MEKQGSTLDGQASGLVEHVLTKEEQARLTPYSVLGLLAEGNARFASGDVTLHNHQAQVRRAALHQFPKAIVLSCIDSRVPVEDVFDRGIGDLFVARVAGSFVNTDILGSMEFACKVSGAKLILVLGHGDCGAVKGAIDSVELGNITAMLDKIKPAVNAFPDYMNEKTGSNAEFVRMVAEENVRLNVDSIPNRAPFFQEMEANGEIKIVGGMYDMETGPVTFMPPARK